MNGGLQCTILMQEGIHMRNVVTPLGRIKAHHNAVLGQPTYRHMHGLNITELVGILELHDNAMGSSEEASNPLAETPGGVFLLVDIV